MENISSAVERLRRIGESAISAMPVLSQYFQGTDKDKYPRYNGEMLREDIKEILETGTILYEAHN